MRIYFVFLAVVAWGEGVRREECFPVERLPAEERAAAEKLYLQLMDSEALYTVVGGVKPMSGGFVTFRMVAGALEAKEVDAARRMLAEFRCGEELVATVHHFGRLFADKEKKGMERYFEGVVLHRGGLKRMVEGHREFFCGLGLTEAAHALETVMTVEYQESGARFRGLGYLYGYPDYAVDFFVGAAREQGLTGEFVKRDFIGMPTFARAERGVVYAVAKGASEREEDRRLRERLAGILEEYRRRRGEWVGEGKAGIVGLLRDWFCGQEAVCRGISGVPGGL